VVNEVLDHGVSIYAKDTDGFHIAAECNEVGAVNGNTPLHNSAINLNLAALSALLKHGARVNAKENSFQTPLHYAATNQAPAKSKSCRNG